MLGSVAEAADVVQDALMRMTSLEDVPGEPAAWMTTVATRLSIDHLRLARVRRESYVGPWLPEPLMIDATPGPGERMELADSVSQAFLVVLEQLTPLERAAFLLREVFDYDYARVATVIDRSEANCRQLVTRAKKHLRASRPRLDTDRDHGQALLKQFLVAAEDGDLASLEAMLAEDVVLYGDGGGKVQAAAEPVAGARAVARFVAAITRERRRLGDFELELATVNGQPGRVLRDSRRAVWDVLSIDVFEGRIQAIRVARNPDKLGHL